MSDQSQPKEQRDAVHVEAHEGADVTVNAPEQTPPSPGEVQEQAQGNGEQIADNIEKK